MGRVKAQLYFALTPFERKKLRDLYVKQQNNLCLYCKEPLIKTPPFKITKMSINWSRFPPNFLKFPVHLQHNHKTGMTEGAVHAYCNAVMWQYKNR